MNKDSVTGMHSYARKALENQIKVLYELLNPESPSTEPVENAEAK